MSVARVLHYSAVLESIRFWSRWQDRTMFPADCEAWARHYGCDSRELTRILMAAAIWRELRGDVKAPRPREIGPAMRQRANLALNGYGPPDMERVF